MSLLAKNVVWSLLGQILPALAAFIATPLIISGLSPERFGILLTLFAILAYVGLLGNGFVLGLTQSLAENQGTPAQGIQYDFGAVVRGSLLTLFILSLLFSLALLLLQNELTYRILNIPAHLQSETRGAFQILAAIIPCVVVNAGLRGVLFAYQAFQKANLIQIPLGVLAALTPLLILPFTKSLIPMLSLMLILQVIALIYYWREALLLIPALNFKMTFELAPIKSILHFGGWLSISSVVGPVMLYLDRFVIGSLISMSAVTLYATPYDFVTKLWVIPAALCGPLFSVASMTYSNDMERTRQIYFKGLKFVFVALIPLVLLLITFAKEGLSLWINPEFGLNAYRVTQWLAIGVLINSLTQVSLFTIIALKRPDIPGKLHLLELPFYIVALYFFVHNWGMLGAALVWVLRIVVDAVLITLLTVRFLGLSIKKIYNVVYLSTVIAIMILISFVITGIIAKIIFLIIGIGGVMAFSWQILLQNEDRIWLSQLLFKSAKS